jgi:hypothetical protein
MNKPPRDGHFNPAFGGTPRQPPFVNFSLSLSAHQAAREKYNLKVKSLTGKLPLFRSSEKAAQLERLSLLGDLVCIERTSSRIE